MADAFNQKAHEIGWKKTKKWQEAFQVVLFVPSIHPRVPTAQIQFQTIKLISPKLFGIKTKTNLEASFVTNEKKKHPKNNLRLSVLFDAAFRLQMNIFFCLHFLVARSDPLPCSIPVQTNRIIVLTKIIQPCCPKRISSWTRSRSTDGQWEILLKSGGSSQLTHSYFSPLWLSLLFVFIERFGGAPEETDIQGLWSFVVRQLSSSASMVENKWDDCRNSCPEVAEGQKRQNWRRSFWLAHWHLCRLCHLLMNRLRLHSGKFL